jgi:hypothetical protein
LHDQGRSCLDCSPLAVTAPQDVRVGIVDVVRAQRPTTEAQRLGILNTDFQKGREGIDEDVRICSPRRGSRRSIRGRKIPKRGCRTLRCGCDERVEHRVALRAFLEDAAFRAAVNSKLPSSHRLTDPVQRPDPRTFELIYAVVSRSKKPIDKALPFFSRLNLRNAARQLRAFGYPVALTKIES